MELIRDVENIAITKEVDEHLYNGLLKLLNNKYLFDNNDLSYQKDDEIRWFSD